MTRPALPGLVLQLPSCHRCGSAPATRRRHHPLYGHRSYCRPCSLVAGDTEEAIVRDMGRTLARAAEESAVDLGDWRTVQAWLLARHWSRCAVDALGEQALDWARRRIQAARRVGGLSGPLETAIEAIGAFGAAAVWCALYCILCPPDARAAGLAAAPIAGAGWVAELIPVAFALALTGLAINAALCRRPRSLHDLDRDTDDWSDL